MKKMMVSLLTSKDPQIQIFCIISVCILCKSGRPLTAVVVSAHLTQELSSVNLLMSHSLYIYILSLSLLLQKLKVQQILCLL